MGEEGGDAGVGVEEVGEGEGFKSVACVPKRPVHGSVAKVSRGGIVKSEQCGDGGGDEGTERG